jgi:hypothetical protein
MLGAILGRIWGWLLAGGALLAAAYALYQRGGRDRAAALRQAALEREQQAQRDRARLDEELRSLPSDQLSRRLHPWVKRR